MPLSHDFRETVVNRARRDPEFRAALIEDALQTMLDGDFATARDMLRDVVHATVGFERLSKETHVPVKSLMRMVGPRGNPTATNLFAILASVQRQARVRARVDMASTKTGDRILRSARRARAYARGETTGGA